MSDPIAAIDRCPVCDEPGMVWRYSDPDGQDWLVEHPSIHEGQKGGSGYSCLLAGDPFGTNSPGGLTMHHSTKEG